MAAGSSCVLQRVPKKQTERDKEAFLEISVHILKLPTLPQRVVTDPETRLLYDKAYNCVFFFNQSKMETTFCGIIFPLYKLSGHTTKRNGDRNLKEEKIQNKPSPKHKTYESVPFLASSKPPGLLSSSSCSLVSVYLSVCLHSEQQPWGTAGPAAAKTMLFLLSSMSPNVCSDVTSSGVTSSQTPLKLSSVSDHADLYSCPSPQLVGTQLLLLELNSMCSKCCYQHKLSLKLIHRPYHGDRMEVLRGSH